MSIFLGSVRWGRDCGEFSPSRLARTLRMASEFTGAKARIAADTTAAACGPQPRLGALSDQRPLELSRGRRAAPVACSSCAGVAAGGAQLVELRIAPRSLRSRPVRSRSDGSWLR